MCAKLTYRSKLNFFQEANTMDLKYMHPADQLVEMMNRIYQAGMTTTSGGNLSVLDENGDIWITPSGVDKGSLTREDIVQVKPDGSCFCARGHKPSVELPFHRDIYGVRKDIFGVVHAHPPVMVGYSVVRRSPDVRILPETWKLCGEVAQVPYDVAGSLELDAHINARFKEGYSTVLMANHGVVCGAENLQKAFEAFETITLGGETEMNALRLGGANILSEEQLAAAAQESALPEMPARPVSEEEQAAREEICAFARRCYQRRLVAAVQGSISMRLSDGSMLITPAGKDLLHLQSGDIVRVKDGRCEAGKIPGENAELQEKIYAKNPGMNSIIITHAPSIMGFGVAGKDFDSRTMSEGYVILGQVQRAPFDADAEAVSDLFGYRKNIVLVDNRCAVVAGETLFKAFDRTEVLEYGAASLLAAGALGMPIIPLTEEEIAYTDRTLGL